MKLKHFNRACDKADELTSGGSVLSTLIGFVAVLPVLAGILVVDALQEGIGILLAQTSRSWFARPRSG